MKLKTWDLIDRSQKWVRSNPMFLIKECSELKGRRKYEKRHVASGRCGWFSSPQSRIHCFFQYGGACDSDHIVAHVTWRDWNGHEVSCAWVWHLSFEMIQRMDSGSIWILNFFFRFFLFCIIHVQWQQYMCDCINNIVGHDDNFIGHLLNRIIGRMLINSFEE